MYTVSCKASYGKKSKLIRFVRKTITGHSTRPHLMELIWALYIVLCTTEYFVAHCKVERYRVWCLIENDWFHCNCA